MIRLILRFLLLAAAAAGFAWLADRPGTIVIRWLNREIETSVLAGLAGLAVWWELGGTLWLAGGLLMLANWPWTLMAIMPVNNKLKAGGGDQATDLLNRWARLHAVRTLLSFAAVTCFAIASQFLR